MNTPVEAVELLALREISPTEENVAQGRSKNETGLALLNGREKLSRWTATQPKNGSQSWLIGACETKPALVSPCSRPNKNEKRGRTAKRLGIPRGNCDRMKPGTPE
jgi:hypothetical protein